MAKRRSSRKRSYSGRKSSNSLLIIFGGFIIICMILMFGAYKNKQDQTRQEVQASTIVATPAPDTRPCGNYGDLNGDRVINSRDLDTIGLLAVKKPAPTGTHIQAGTTVNHATKRGHITWNGTEQDISNLNARDSLAISKFISSKDKSQFYACKLTKKVIGGCRVGDADYDGYITYLDADRIMMHESSPTKYPLSVLVADVNNDNKINSTDAVLIKSYAKGLITSFKRKCGITPTPTPKTSIGDPWSVSPKPAN